MVGFTEAARRIDDLRDECVEFLIRTCSIPALGPDNHGTGEMEKYRAVKQVIDALGPDKVVEVHAPDERVPDGVRPNLAAIFEGVDTSRTFWILSHIDVVPPGERALWDFDPFQPFLAEGAVHGRGVEDNGQALAASVFAVRAVKETGRPAINVGLVVVSDEETGSRFGLDYVLQKRLDLFSPDDMVLVPDAGNANGDHIEVAEKHLLQVGFRIKGRQGHASRPDLCVNSLRAAAHLIVELDQGLPARFPEQDPFFNPSTSTFEPTKKQANVPNINTIPGEDTFYLDCRVLPNVDLNDVLGEMRSAAERIAGRFAVSVTVEEQMKFGAPPATPADAAVVVACAQAVQEVYGVQARPVGIGGQTVAAFFRKRGLKAAVWERILGMAHAPNERVPVEHLIGDAKVFARMMF